MVEKCVVYGCTNSKNKQKGISMHKIPSDSDPRAEVRRRRQRWIKFVNQTRKHWTPGKTSSICSVHFKHEDFTRPFNSNLKRALREDEFGVCLWPTIHVSLSAIELLIKVLGLLFRPSLFLESPGILNRQKDTLPYLSRKTLRKKTYFCTKLVFVSFHK